MDLSFCSPEGRHGSGPQQALPRGQLWPSLRRHTTPSQEGRSSARAGGSGCLDLPALLIDRIEKAAASLTHSPERGRIVPGRSASETCLDQPPGGRSEEHTSELQSHHDLVCRLLLEKKKKNKSEYSRLTKKKNITKKTK